MRSLLVSSVLLIALAGCAAPEEPVATAEESAGATEEMVSSAESASPVEMTAAEKRVIMAAVAPLPEQFRATASVRARTEGSGDLIELRRGDGPYICLADDPTDERFHVACYHASLDPFMARGRELRAQGMTTGVDSVRFADVAAGRLAMPPQPAALYSLSGDSVSIDDSTGTVSGASPLYVVYIANATAESTGLPTVPMSNSPWLMFPGTPKAHIMFVPEM
jgi:hypothetical protein